jgi:hypothetical protein
VPTLLATRPAEPAASIAKPSDLDQTSRSVAFPAAGAALAQLSPAPPDDRPNPARSAAPTPIKSAREARNNQIHGFQEADTAAEAEEQLNNCTTVSFTLTPPRDDGELLAGTPPLASPRSTGTCDQHHEPRPAHSAADKHPEGFHGDVGVQCSLGHQLVGVVRTGAGSNTALDKMAFDGGHVHSGGADDGTGTAWSMYTNATAVPMARSGAADCALEHEEQRTAQGSQLPDGHTASPRAARSGCHEYAAAYKQNPWLDNARQGQG